MFQVFYDGALIGETALETGDPPMGCAEGRFLPLAGFKRFLAVVPPKPDSEVAIKRWVELSVMTNNGNSIDCIDVVLCECDFGGEKELHVDALGINLPTYEDLFPGRYSAYEKGLVFP